MGFAIQPAGRASLTHWPAVTTLNPEVRSVLVESRARQLRSGRDIMILRKHPFVALAFLGCCLSPLLSCAPQGSAVQSYAPVAAQAPGTARVWFLRTRDPQE